MANPSRIFPLLLGLVVPTMASDRINHEGRILGAQPVVSAPILFNTPEADAVLAAMQVFPATSPWNEDISQRPLLSNSDAMISQISAELRSDRRTLRAFFEMNFVLVPDNQPTVPIDFFNYADESDPSPYPIPTNLPIETWPRETGDLTLADWQTDIEDAGGDRHAVVVQPGKGLFWETWLTKRVGNDWEASNGAKFDLKSNTLRPADWTSGDAAGLPMFPALVRYDECERGMVEHAVRLVVKHTRRQYIYPATHFASVPSTTDPNVPAMGERLRLKADFKIPDNWSKHEKAVLSGLKKYGAIIADNGNFFSISVTPDNRWPDSAFSHLSSLSITNFEVIQTTGPMEGPRSAGAPTVDAGADQAGFAINTILSGTVDSSSANLAARWTVVTGPGSVTFADDSKPQTSASFSAPGEYTLMLSAADGTHTPAYDTVHVTVGNSLQAQISLNGPNLQLSWQGGQPPYRVESCPTLTSGEWSTLITTNALRVTISPMQSSGFFRISGN